MMTTTTPTVAPKSKPRKSLPQYQCPSCGAEDNVEILPDHALEAGDEVARPGVDTRCRICGREGMGEAFLP
jgi:hypothetical protein